MLTFRVFNPRWFLNGIRIVDKNIGLVWFSDTGDFLKGVTNRHDGLLEFVFRFAFTFAFIWFRNLGVKRRWYCV